MIKSKNIELKKKKRQEEDVCLLITLPGGISGNETSGTCRRRPPLTSRISPRLHLKRTDEALSSGRSIESQTWNTFFPGNRGRNPVNAFKDFHQSPSEPVTPLALAIVSRFTPGCRPFSRPHHHASSRLLPLKDSAWGTTCCCPAAWLELGGLERCWAFLSFLCSFKSCTVRSQEHTVSQKTAVVFFLWEGRLMSYYSKSATRIMFEYFPLHSHMWLSWLTVVSCFPKPESKKHWDDSHDVSKNRIASYSQNIP